MVIYLSREYFVQNYASFWPRIFVNVLSNGPSTVLSNVSRKLEKLGVNEIIAIMLRFPAAVICKSRYEW